MKSNNDSRAKHKAIPGRVSDYLGFKLSENGSILCVENVYCMTYHVSFNCIVDLYIDCFSQ